MNIELIKAWLKQNEPNSSTKLAAACGVSPGTIARILKGKITSLPVAKRIAAHIGVSLDKLSEEELAS